MVHGLLGMGLGFRAWNAAIWGSKSATMDPEA